MAGRGTDEGRRKLPGSGRAQPSRPRPEVTAPGTEKPRWRAERRHASATVRNTLRMDAPLGAPSPRFMRETEKGTTAYPAPKRIRAMTLVLARTGQVRHARRWLTQCSRNSPLIAFSSAGLIS